MVNTKRAQKTFEILVQFIILLLVIFFGIFIAFKVLHLDFSFMQNMFGKKYDFAYYFTPSQIAVHKTMLDLSKGVGDYIKYINHEPDIYRELKSKYGELFYLMDFLYPLKSVAASDKTKIKLELPHPLQYYPYYPNVEWYVVFRKNESIRDVAIKYSEAIKYCYQYFKMIDSKVCPVKFKVENQRVVKEFEKNYRVIITDDTIFVVKNNDDSVVKALKDWLKALRKEFECDDSTYDYDKVVKVIYSYLKDLAINGKQKISLLMKPKIKSDKFLKFSDFLKMRLDYVFASSRFSGNLMGLSSSDPPNVNVVVFLDKTKKDTKFENIDPESYQIMDILNRIRNTINLYSFENVFLTQAYYMDTNHEPPLYFFNPLLPLPFQKSDVKSNQLVYVPHPIIKFLTFECSNIHIRSKVMESLRFYYFNYDFTKNFQSTLYLKKIEGKEIKRENAFSESFVITHVDVPEDMFHIFSSTMENIKKDVNLLGDPSYVIYFTKFPQGLERYWTNFITGARIQVASCMAQMVLDLFPFLNSKIASVVFKTMSENIKKVFSRAIDLINKIRALHTFISKAPGMKRVIGSISDVIARFKYRKLKRISAAKIVDELYIDSMSDALLKLKKYGKRVSDIIRRIDNLEDLKMLKVTDARYGDLMILALKEFNKDNFKDYFKYKLESLLSVITKRVDAKKLVAFEKISDEIIDSIKHGGNYLVISKKLVASGFSQDYSKLVAKKLIREWKYINSFNDYTRMDYLMKQSIKYEAVSNAIDILFGSDIAKVLKIDASPLVRRRLKFLFMTFLDEDLKNYDDVVKVFKNELGIFGYSKIDYFSDLLELEIKRQFKLAYQQRIIESNIGAKMINRFAKLARNAKFAKRISEFFPKVESRILFDETHFRAFVLDTILEKQFNLPKKIRTPIVAGTLYGKVDDNALRQLKRLVGKDINELTVLVQNINDLGFEELYILYNSLDNIRPGKFGELVEYLRNSMIKRYAFSKDGLMKYFKTLGLKKEEIEKIINTLNKLGTNVVDKPMTRDEFIKGLKNYILKDSLLTDLKKLSDFQVDEQIKMLDSYDAILKNKYYLPEKQLIDFSKISPEFFDKLTELSKKRWTTLPTHKLINNIMRNTLNLLRLHYGLILKEEIRKEVEKIIENDKKCKYDDFKTSLKEVFNKYGISLDASDDEQKLMNLKKAISEFFEEFDVDYTVDDVDRYASSIASLMYDMYEKNEEKEDVFSGEVFKENYDNLINSMYTFLCNYAKQTEDENLKSLIFSYDLLMILTRELMPIKFKDALTKFAIALSRGGYASFYGLFDYASMYYFGITIPVFSIGAEVQGQLLDMANQKYSKSGKNTFFVHALASVDPALASYFYREYYVNYDKPFLLTFDINDENYAYLADYYGKKLPWFMIVSPCQGDLIISSGNLKCSVDKDVVFDGKNIYQFNYEKLPNHLKVLRSVLAYLLNEKSYYNLEDLKSDYTNFMTQEVKNALNMPFLLQSLQDNVPIRTTFVALIKNNMLLLDDVNCSLSLFSNEKLKGGLFSQLSNEILGWADTENDKLNNYLNCLNNYYNAYQKQYSDVTYFDILYSDFYSLFENVTLNRNLFVDNGYYVLYNALSMYLKLNSKNKLNVNAVEEFKQILKRVSSKELLKFECLLYGLKKKGFLTESILYENSEIDKFCKFLERVKLSSSSFYIPTYLHLKYSDFKIDKEVIGNVSFKLNVAKEAINWLLKYSINLVFGTDLKFDKKSLTFENPKSLPSKNNPYGKGLDGAFSNFEATLTIEDLNFDIISSYLLAKSAGAINNPYNPYFVFNNYSLPLNFNLEVWLSSSGSKEQVDHFVINEISSPSLSESFFKCNKGDDNWKNICVGNYVIDSKKLDTVRILTDTIKIKTEDNYRFQTLKNDKKTRANYAKMFVAKLYSALLSLQLIQSDRIWLFSINDFLKKINEEHQYNFLDELSEDQIIPLDDDYSEILIPLILPDGDDEIISELRKIEEMGFVYLPIDENDVLNLIPICPLSDVEIDSLKVQTENVLFAKYLNFQGACFPSNYKKGEKKIKLSERVTDGVMWAVAGLSFTPIVGDILGAAMDAYQCYVLPFQLKQIELKYKWPEHPMDN